MTDSERHRFSAKAARIYDRMLSRVEKSLAEREVKTWETVREEIANAVAFEQGVEELTRDEVDLLAAYLERDLAHLLHHVSSEEESDVREWLQLDIALVERGLVDMLFSIADRTTLDTLELTQKLQHPADKYMAGEVATAGVLRCLECGEVKYLKETTHLEPCSACGSHYFERVTARQAGKRDAGERPAS